jgi:hypothetical protein
MPAKTDHKSEEQKEPAQETEILFRCKFCGENKPLSELIMIRNYYPPMGACNACFRAHNNNAQ